MVFSVADLEDLDFEHLTDLNLELQSELGYFNAFMGKPKGTTDGSVEILTELAQHLPPRERAQFSARMRHDTQGRAALIDALMMRKRKGPFEGSLVSTDGFAAMYPHAAAVIERVTGGTPAVEQRGLAVSSGFAFNAGGLCSQLMALPGEHGKEFAAFVTRHVTAGDAAPFDIGQQLRALSTHGQGVHPEVKSALGRGPRRASVLACLQKHL